MITHKPLMAVALSGSLLWAAAPWASAGEAKGARKKAAKPAAADTEGMAEAEPTEDITHQARFKTYLQQRLAKIKEAHQSRMDFFAKEGAVWQAFWSKVRDDRNVFELRSARRILNLFESLNSLDRVDHPPIIAGFEKMHESVIQKFEDQQRQKMLDFFAAREARWKAFAVDQDKLNAEFVADGTTLWEESKATLKGEKAPEKAKEPAAEAEEEAPKPAKKPSVSSKDRAGEPSGWH